MEMNVDKAHQAIILALVVFVLVLLLGLVVLLYRRRYFGARVDEPQGFTLADVRRMHREGQLSDEEYERMRQAVIGMSAGRPEGPPEGAGKQDGS